MQNTKKKTQVLEMQVLWVWCVNSDFDSSLISAALLKFIIGLKQRSM